MYGRPPPTLANYIPGTAQIEAVEVSLQTRDDKLKVLRRTLQSAQAKMKAQADKKRTDFSFSVGDMVLVKLQPYGQHSAIHRTSYKMSKRYFGPFSIIARIGQVAYKLLLPQSSKIHPVFHISILKKFIGNPPPNSPILRLQQPTTDPTSSHNR